MLLRGRALSLIIAFLGATFVTAAPLASPVRAAGPKVAIIVGPVGGLTDSYRRSADRVATEAAAAGATVVKAYSPNATWPNVLAAVNGANVIVYFGHGNGSPNPYSGWNELTDRVNGWGLNTSTSNGDADSWSAGSLVYCGEKALFGTLGAGDGAAQRTYCAGGPITPAPGFVMVYGQAHYAPGFGERYEQSTPITTLAEAQGRVRNYSYPILALGGTYFATAYSDAHEIVSRVLSQPTTGFGSIFAQGDGYSPSTLTAAAHPDVAGAEYWVQQTIISGFHFGEPDFWYAFAGNPNATPGLGNYRSGGPYSDIGWSPFFDDIVWISQAGITNGCGDGRYCPADAVTRAQMASFIARALGLPAATADYFPDDVGSLHEGDINRLAQAGITNGCGNGLYCPNTAVTRDQMASFIARALGLPAAGADYFTDDTGSFHEPDINRLAAAGVTNGCGSGVYCPTQAITREQMAAFLHRALD
ncbi:MAG TPA: S-layer homology domain-containing protein [Candidatus Limnocylindria bacterium]|nr:S-layer homology domain-containing protein [Candidatus Limnocylindria bacterium]